MVTSFTNCYLLWIQAKYDTSSIRDFKNASCMMQVVSTRLIFMMKLTNPTLPYQDAPPKCVRCNVDMHIIHFRKGQVHFQWGNQVVLKLRLSAFGHRLPSTHHELGLQTVKCHVGVDHRLCCYTGHNYWLITNTVLLWNSWHTNNYL